MPSFSFGCATQVAAKRGRTAARPHGRKAARQHRTSAWRHGGTAHHRMSAPHCGTHGTATRQHSTAHVCTAERPCGHTARTAGARARPTRRSPLESSPRRRQRPGSTHASASSRPLSRPRARTAAARPRATERRWRRQSVHTPPLQPAYTRSLRTPAAGPHRGPLLRLSLRRRSLRGEARRGRGRRSQHRADRGATGARCSDGSGLGATTAERIARPMCPRSRGEIARSRRAERLAQVAHCPRGNALPGEIALSVRKGSRSGSAQAGQARPWP